MRLAAKTAKGGHDERPHRVNNALLVSDSNARAPLGQSLSEWDCVGRSTSSRMVAASHSNESRPLSKGGAFARKRRFRDGTVRVGVAAECEFNAIVDGRLSSRTS